MPMNVGGTCYCIPVETGDSDTGDPCPIFNIHSEGDQCKVGLSCLGTAADAESLACTVDTSEWSLALRRHPDELNPDQPVYARPWPT